jgi:hypothetical protein
VIPSAGIESYRAAKSADFAPSVLSAVFVPRAGIVSSGGIAPTAGTLCHTTPSAGNANPVLASIESYQAPASSEQQHHTERRHSTKTERRGRTRDRCRFRLCPPPASNCPERRHLTDGWHRIVQTAMMAPSSRRAPESHRARLASGASLHQRSFPSTCDRSPPPVIAPLHLRSLPSTCERFTSPIAPLHLRALPSTCERYPSPAIASL